MSQLQKIILATLYSYKIEHGWESVPQYRLTRDIAKQHDRIEHVDKNQIIQRIEDHAGEALRKVDTREEMDLIVKMVSSYVHSIPKRGRHFVNASTRASISRSIRRLEQRNLIEKDHLFGCIKLKVSLDWLKEVVTEPGGVEEAGAQ